MTGLAEREGFEPPIGLHLCRISSAVHSTTLPPLQAPLGAVTRLRSGRVLGEDGGPGKARLEGISRPQGPRRCQARVGPPDAKKTGGPVSLHCNLAGSAASQAILSDALTVAIRARSAM